MTAVDSRRLAGRGFTLIELLVAMVIFAILAVLAYGGLRSVIATGGGVEKQMARLEELQRGMMIIERDIRQMMPRAVNTDLGQRRAALIVDSAADRLLEFTRGGNPNPIGAHRSSLQRVAYVLDEEGGLKRFVWNQPDYLSSQNPVEMTLLKGVRQFSLRLLRANGRWDSSWGQTQGDLEMIPEAVEITLEHQAFSEIRRVFPLR